MKSHVLVLSGVVAIGGVFGENAAAKMAASAAGARPADSGRIGNAPPRANAAGLIRALGLDDDGGPGSENDDGGVTRGRVAHSTIGHAPPGPNAAGRIRALGSDD